MQLEIGDNLIPGSNNEIITLERFDLCYRISSKANTIDSLYMDYRTFTLDFGDKIPSWELPIFANLYATSFENSIGTEGYMFYHGKPVVAQIVMNHHTSMSFKMKRIEVLKEKHTDCSEITYWEALEKVMYPRLVENCTNPCFNYPVPSDRLSTCFFDDSAGEDESLTKTDADRDCAGAVFMEIRNTEGGFYNYKSCSIEEYEGRVLKDNEIIPGKEEFWYWPVEEDWEVAVPESDHDEGHENFTFKFSYTFDSPEALTVEVETYIVTFFDLVGIVGGTLGLFIGFAFYDNILASVEYLIIIVKWVKRNKGMKKASKISDMKMSSEAETPKEETPKEESPKTPKEETPKEVTPKEEAREEETRKEKTPNEGTPKEENPEEEIPKQESAKKEPQVQA